MSSSVRPKPGERYYNFKNSDKTYLVCAIAKLESTQEECVVYRSDADDDEFWVRTVDSWMSEPSPGAERFTRVS